MAGGRWTHSVKGLDWTGDSEWIGMEVNGLEGSGV